LIEKQKPGGSPRPRPEGIWERGPAIRQIGAAPAPGSGGERIGVLMQRLLARRMRGKAK